MDLIRTAIQRPVTVSMFVVAVILFGLVSLDRLALNLLPDISYPSLTVQTDYEDAAPEEVESLITQPIEEAVGVVPGLTKMTSISRSGQSEVVLEFSWDTDMDLASLEVREKLDFVDLLRDAEKPVILRFDPSHDPIMRIRVYGDISLSALRYAAEEELKKHLDSTDGVAAIKVIGGLEEQIPIEVDEKRLAELGIPITEVTDVLRQENLNQAAGSLYDQDANYLVRMLNEFRSVEEIEQIIIRNQQGRKVVLGDVARVWRGTKDREVITRLNGKESVEMAIYKQGDANTVTVARAVIRAMETLAEKERFPKNVDYEVVSNQAEFIQNSVFNVLSAAVLGGILATLILFVFLRDLRSTLTIAFSIPISIMATFALMYQTGITLNIMSLGGVALGVGMLVDNSIVVLEAIHRHRKQEAGLAETVHKGTQEVSRAVTASTLTTIAVFLPLIFVEGIAGQLFKDQALTITYALLASLLVALTCIPMIIARGGRGPEENALTDTPPNPPKPMADGNIGPFFGTLNRNLVRVLRFVFVETPRVVVMDVRRLFRTVGRSLLRLFSPVLNRFERGFNTLSRRYPQFLQWSLNNKAAVFGSAFFLTAASVWMAVYLGAELIPPLIQGEFAFEIKLPEGSPLQYTNRVMQAVETRVAGYREVGTVFSSVGGSTENQFARNTLQENTGQLYVVMKDKRDESREAEVIDRVRADLQEYPDITCKFKRPTLFSFRTPVEVEVYSYDLQDLQETASLVASNLGEIQGLTDIKTSTKPGDPEIHVHFNRERLARLGLEENQISSVLRTKIRGDVATRYREEDKQIDVLVRVEEADRNTIANLKNLVINSGSWTRRGEVRFDSGERQPVDSEQPNVVPIRLAAVADVKLGRGPSEIRRIRSQRAAIVSANLVGRDLSSVSEEIRGRLQQLRAAIPTSTTVMLAGQNEELEKSYKSLLFAFALAVFLVYLVMASQFESLVHPFIIIFTVPFGVVGVLLALFLTGTTISIVVFLGAIVLAGIVVNNAIVLIDYTNLLRRQGLAKREALLQAGHVRLRPILMTTLTTVLGLIPMALGWGEGAEVRAPMAIAVMGGLLFSTLITLILIPVVYELVDRKVYVGSGTSPHSAPVLEAPTGDSL
ncbi:efflux RND transporter permease subunit [Acidobacteria bacterium AH-259-L09]|nr:efflux RND transporter permease subunit [Acidobacteria bacterium AH-259-L09]